ncbi:MAG: hypothetical protein LBI39_00195 [Puniceicoccales bacterium]|nr:hypothetical protein [Puniceicoccales bacterium]
MGRWDTFSAARLRRRFGLALVVALLVAATVAINVFSERHHFRFCAADFGRRLDECVPLAKSIGSPLQIYVIEEERNGEGSDRKWRQPLGNFLESAKVRFAEDDVALAYDFVSMDLERGKIAEWFAGCSPPLQPHGGIFLRGGNSVRAVPSARTLSDFELADALADALGSIGSAFGGTVYFLRGHGERSPHRLRGDGGLWRLRQWVLRHGWQISQLCGEEIDGMDGSNSILAVVDPRSPFSCEELASLLAFLEEKRGRILIVITEHSHPSILEFLCALNVIVDQRPLVRADGWSGTVRFGDFSSAVSYLAPLVDLEQPVHFSSACPMREGAGNFAAGHVRVERLIAASSQAHSATCAVAVSAEGGSVSDAPVAIAPWKMVVVGGDFISNQYFSLCANTLFFQQILQYLSDGPAERQRPPESPFQIALEPREMISLAVACGAVPAIFSLLLYLPHMVPRRRRSH